MSKLAGSGRVGLSVQKNRTKKSNSFRARRIGFECLEHRNLLAVVAAPTSIVFQPQSGQGTATLTSANNSLTSKELQFLVSGVSSGNTVSVYVDGGTTAIGTGTVASGATSITVTTNGTSKLSDGTHVFTATQSSGSTASASSPGDQIQVFANLTLTSGGAKSATVGQLFTYTVQTNAPSGDAVTVTPGATLPGDMAFNATTNTFTWTPTAADVGATPSFTMTLADSVGNSPAANTVFVAVSATSGVSVLAPPASVAIGSPALVAINSADTGTPTFSVTTSDSSKLTATLMPQSNQVLKIVTDQGEMDIQLLNNYTPSTVAHFVSLVNSNTYANATFYRIIQTFMSQGGSNGSGSAIPVELNADLRFTTSGLLAMANNGVDGNTSEFFITSPNDTSNSFLDFRYTVFGKLIKGENVREAIAATPVGTNPSSGEPSQPVTAPKILSMSVTTDTQDGVFLLKALPGASGSYTVTVSDGLGGSKNFTVTIGANAYDPPNPWVAPINGTDTISTTANQAVTFTPQGGAAAAAGGVAPQIDVQLLQPVPTVADAYVDSSYVPLISGTFELKVGTLTTAAITFNSADPTTTAANIQSALRLLTGLSAATVTANAPTPGTNPTSFSFSVTFAGSEAPVTYVTLQNLEATFANSTSVATAVQTLTFHYSGPMADTTNPNMTLTQNGSSYTVTPASGYYGVQFLEVMGLTSVLGTFQLKVGSVTTSDITFYSGNLPWTAVNIQNALQAAGFSGATVSVEASSTAPHFRFKVTFAGNQSPISYVASTAALPVTFANSVTSTTAVQELTFAATGASWDSGSGVAPVYRAFVPVYVAPPSPQIASVSVGNQTVTGGTFANNSTTATALSFRITGAIAGATVSVYVDGGATPIAKGTVAAGATTITLTTDGTTKLADGNRHFTVTQSIATHTSSLYADWTSGSVGTQFSVAANSVVSPASAGTTLAIGLTALAPPITSARVGSLYTYVVQTNAPSGDTVTVTPGTMPAGMVFNNVDTFTWTPTSAQLNTSPAFSAQVSDALGHSIAIGPVNISVGIGLTPTQIPVNASKGGDVTVQLTGSKVMVYDNIAHAVLSSATFSSTDTIEIDCPAGQANSVLIMVPASGATSLPKQVLVQGVASTTSNNQVTELGAAGANVFSIAGGTTSANGLVTAISSVQKLTFAGRGGDDYYRLDSSTTPTWITDAGGYNTLDFSHDTAGVSVNLGLDGGQAQTIAPWNTTLMVNGIISKLIGSQFSDVLTGGRAAMTMIRSGMGNDTITGGSGDNILKGGGGNDTIIGGKGKNLMIAGAGTCSLYANGWQNLVFGGSTNFDSNDQALINLLNQGSRVMFGYSYRRSLASAANNPAMLSSLLTFQDSGATDRIFGSSMYNWLVLGKNDVVMG
jgi:cyclophilin family peptidyl-prolyl cis-trans isomerase